MIPANLHKNQGWTPARVGRWRTVRVDVELPGSAGRGLYPRRACRGGAKACTLLSRLVTASAVRGTGGAGALTTIGFSRYGNGKDKFLQRKHRRAAELRRRPR